ncbi:MAG: pyruvate, phosphate dikinase [Gemmatimonadetes bacterium]|nr:MAG: pyruvate, phosphate dikinase [Gemmatimonadota bacterium]
MSHKWVYFFGKGKSEGNAQMVNLLGGKGANLAEMTNLGVPVPPGFTITTEVCTEFYKNNRQYPADLAPQVEENLKKLEDAMGKTFGDPSNPLLVSVRSGARKSMPGMMDTVLNLGLNDETTDGMAKLTGNPRFAYDSYRRFVQMYGDVVLGLQPENKDEIDPFEAIIEKKKEARGIQLDTELTTDDLKELVAEFKAAIKERTGHDFPTDPMEQLWGAIGAVFGSWNNERAIQYRKMNGFSDDWGTAVNVQAMVFGNMGDDCATGVAFTRDPATGEKHFYGEFLVNAQGEDVVAGIRTPQPIAQMAEMMPEIYQQLDDIRDRLEKHYRDMQDVEFTVEKGKLWMLQTRVGKRTGFAAFRIAVDLVEEGMITKEEALMRVEPDQLNQLLQPVFDFDSKRLAETEGHLIAKGLPAGPGAASGKIYFNAEDAEEAALKRNEAVILVRLETSPEDIRGMAAAKGILTARGGMTSHAALVGRQMGKVCVVGCGALNIDYTKRQFSVGDVVCKEGDYVSIDGFTGEVFAGQIQTKDSEVIEVLIQKSLKPEDAPVYHTYEKMMQWADEVRKLGVRTNADQPDQCENAIAFGAEGIGLTRTEHMFFEGDRITAVREMIVAEDEAGRRKALNKLLPMQKGDFKGIFKVMTGKPCTIRLLDPPLHEFLPHNEAEIKELAATLGVDFEHLNAIITSLEESNPMLGHRGCRLGNTYPEITEMQVRAIMEAACEVKKEGFDPHPEIMVPLISSKEELAMQRQIAQKVIDEVLAENDMEVPYLIGTMIEIPRAALTADEVAEVADFFSFGTNDLTQTGFGISRDDSNKFMPHYLEKGLFEHDPFQKLDQKGIGKLVAWATENGRKTRPDLKVGICGEHGGEPSSVEFCHRIGLNYVSCSPFRVPIARLAAAQAALRDN